MSAQPARPNPCFSLGQVVATPGAIEALGEVNCLPITLLNRHQCGDWGDLCDADKVANHEALGNWTRLFSAYIIQDVKFWVITEADRSATTILLPSEY